MVGEHDFRFEQPCPVRDVLDRIGDQWSLLVLIALEPRTKRFNELLREIGDISRQMLSRTLRRLEEDGFLERKVFAEVPPRVEYELTDYGRTLEPILVQMQAWGRDFKARQAAADATHTDCVLESVPD